MSIDELYKEYADMVYRFLLSKTHSADLAEELTQETFFQAIRSIDKFDDSCRVTTWLCAIAKNQLRAYSRKRKEMAVDIIETHVAPVPSAEEKVLANFDMVQLISHLHNLKEPAREVVYLRLFGDLSFKEIGEIMGQTENWSRVTYYRGKEKVIKELRENG